MSTCNICGSDCEVADARLRIYREFFVGLNKRLDSEGFSVSYNKKELDIETQEWYVGFWVDSLEDTTEQIAHCVEEVFNKISKECTAKKVLIENIGIDITRYFTNGSYYINIGVKYGGE